MNIKYWAFRLFTVFQFIIQLCNIYIFATKYLCAALYPQDKFLRTQKLACQREYVFLKLLIVFLNSLPKRLWNSTPAFFVVVDRRWFILSHPSFKVICFKSLSLLTILIYYRTVQSYLYIQKCLRNGSPRYPWTSYPEYKRCSS